MSTPVDELSTQVLGYPADYYLIRLEDTETGEVEDIPIDGADVVYWWTHGLGSCDCVRWRAFTQARLSMAPDIPCARQPSNRLRLRGIWNRGGEQIHFGEPE